MNTGDRQTVERPLAVQKVPEANTAVLGKEKEHVGDGNSSRHINTVYNIMLSLSYLKFNHNLGVSTVFFLFGRLQ